MSGWTLSASCYCPGGHNTLADSVRTPDTIRESGRNLLAYWVRGGHYPRPDAIRCDTGSFLLLLAGASLWKSQEILSALIMHWNVALYAGFHTGFFFVNQPFISVHNTYTEQCTIAS